MSGFRPYDSARDGPREAPAAAAPVGLDEPFPDPPAAEAFHGLAGEFVRAMEDHVEADPMALLSSFLGLFGAAIGPASYALAGDDEHPARLFIALVGRTARSRKGSSWNPARKRFEAVGDGWAATSILSGLASGEGLIHAVRDPKDGEPKGVKHIAVFEPELSRVLQAAKREGNTLSAVIRDCWDRTTLRVMTRGNPLCATGAHVGIISHITREELLKDVDATAVSNGFANRFLWMAVERKKLIPHAGGSGGVEWGDFDERLRAAVRQAREPGLRLQWGTQKAADYWEEVYRELAEDDPPGRLGAVLARAEAHVLRLTAAFSLLDRSSVLTIPALEAAMAFWAYSAASARWAFGGGAVASVEAELVAWIAKRGGETTVRDLTRGPRRYRGDTEGAERALQALVSKGIGYWVPSRGEGRPDRRFRLGPAGDKRGGGDSGDGDETIKNGRNSVVSSPSPLSPGVSVASEGGPWNGTEPHRDPGEDDDMDTTQGGET